MEPEEQERLDEVLKMVDPSDARLLRRWARYLESEAVRTTRMRERLVIPVGIVATLVFAIFALFFLVETEEAKVIAIRKATEPLHAEVAACTRRLEAVEFACVTACGMEKP